MYGHRYNGQWRWADESLGQMPWRNAFPVDPVDNVILPRAIYPFDNSSPTRPHRMSTLSRPKRVSTMARSDRASKQPRRLPTNYVGSLGRMYRLKEQPSDLFSKVLYALPVLALAGIVAVVGLTVYVSQKGDDHIDGWLTITNVDTSSFKNDNFQQDFCHELQEATTVQVERCIIIGTSVLGEVKFQLLSDNNTKAALDIEMAVMEQMIFTGRQILHNNVDFSSENIQCSVFKCKNGGTCYDTIESFQCACVTGFSGQICDQDTMQCSTSPCLNGGTCMELPLLYSCNCVASYTGINCETETSVVEGWIITTTWTFTNTLLDSNSIDFKTRQTGLCTELGALTTADVMTCDVIFQPASNVRGNFTLVLAADKRLLDDIKITMDYSTLPNIPLDGNRVVISGAGANVCTNHGCQNQAVCVYDRPSGGSVCTCKNGYTGTKCETDIDECSTIACQNNGTCSEGVGTFNCTCAAGFKGELCQTEIDECLSSPCLNGGTCMDQVNSYTCSCPVAATGPICETAISCSDNPCMNMGTCVPLGSGLRCDCHTNYNGHLCENGPLYPYGKANGDSNLSEINKNALHPSQILGTLPMFDVNSVTLRISDNGYIALHTHGEDCNSNASSFDFYPIIAPLYQKNNPESGNSAIYFRETIDVATRSQASTDVCDFLKFDGKTCDFNATYVTILTYENMEPDEVGASGVNTFQVVLATDSSQTYAIFVYGILMRTGTTCPTMVGYSNYDNTDKEVVDLNVIGGFANLVHNSNYGKQPKYIFYLGKASPLHIYGSSLGGTETVLDSSIDDNSLITTNFTSPFLYFGQQYTQVHINSNGYVQFGNNRVKRPCADIMYSDFGPGVAVFVSDFTNVKILYRQITDWDQLKSLSSSVCVFLGGSCSFTATWGFVITWDKAHASDGSLSNIMPREIQTRNWHQAISDIYGSNITSSVGTVTVQLSLVSDGTLSYGIRAYGDIGFVASTCEGNAVSDHFVGIGFTDGLGNGTFVNRIDTNLLPTETNCIVPGRWVMSFNQ